MDNVSPFICNSTSEPLQFPLHFSPIFFRPLLFGCNLLFSKETQIKLFHIRPRFELKASCPTLEFQPPFRSHFLGNLRTSFRINFVF